MGPSDLNRVGYEMTDRIGLNIRHYAQYYVFSLNGDPEVSWEMVRWKLGDPRLRHCYFAKVQVAPMGEITDFEQADQAVAGLPGRVHAGGGGHVPRRRRTPGAGRPTAVGSLKVCLERYGFMAKRKRLNTRLILILSVIVAVRAGGRRVRGATSSAGIARSIRINPAEAARKAEADQDKGDYKAAEKATAAGHQLLLHPPGQGRLLLPVRHGSIWTGSPTTPRR